MTNEKALQAFMADVGDIEKRLEEITKRVGDHLGYHPDEIHWGHVGESGKLLSELTTLRNWLYGKGEYAN